MNETRETLKYFFAVGCHKRGLDTVIGGRGQHSKKTWGERFEEMHGESHSSYVARAKRDGLGDRAREHARVIGESTKGSKGP